MRIHYYNIYQASVNKPQAVGYRLMLCVVMTNDNVAGSLSMQVTQLVITALTADSNAVGSLVVH